MVASTAEKTRKRRKPATKAKQSPAPIEPREIALPKMRALNQLYRQRPPVKLTILGERFSLSAVWPPTHAESACASIAFSVEDTRGELVLPLATLDAWIRRIDAEADLDRLTGEHAALLLECFLERDLGRLEQHLDCRISILSVDRAPAAFGDYPFAFRFTRGDEDIQCALALEDEGWGIRLGRALNELQRKKAPPRLDLPVTLAIWRGATSLSLAEVRALAPGDVIISDEINPAQDVAVAVFAGRFAAPVRATEDGWLAMARPASVAGTKWEWIMDQSKKTDQAAIEDSELEDLPLTVAFELGRVGMSLKDVSQLTPGAVVRVTDVPDQTVDLLANGKRIGRGEIVRVGDGLGVQVTRIFGDA